MAKDNVKETERRRDELEKCVRLSDGAESSETARRIAAVEKLATDLNARIFDVHQKFVGYLFSVVAVIIVGLGINSAVQVRDSTKDMESRVVRATSEMEKKVQAFVGEAMKKPRLEAVTADGSPIDGTTNIASFGGMVQIYSVFLKNVGEKRSEPLSISISLNPSFNLSERSDWENAPSHRREFATTFFLNRPSLTVASGQTISIPALPINGDLSTPRPCELEVFYGGEQALKTRFFIKAQ